MSQEPRIIEINGMKFSPLPGVFYPIDYVKHFDRIGKDVTEQELFREFILRGDLFFVIYFILKMEAANHPFVIQACRDVRNGPQTMTLDVWAREHFKSTIITVAESICDIMRNPEERIAIISYARPAAKAFLNSLKSVFENSDFLKYLFPDVLYENPLQQAERWGEESGLIVKRKSFAKESTVEAWGLHEGMPTSRHFTKRIYDDIETLDLVNTPDLIESAQTAFDMSENIGCANDRQRIIGTYYHHNGLLMYIRGKKRSDGTPLYQYRFKTATENGEANGKSVLLPEEKLDILRSNQRTFNSQQLCNPTPSGSVKLNSSYLKDIEPRDIPKNLYKFMLVDAAGQRKDARPGDGWALGVVGVEPCLENLGASHIYIQDLIIEPMALDDALKSIVDMYCRNGRILRLGVEKVSISTTEVHVMNALRTKGKHVSIENGTLQVLSPAGRNKAQRIESGLVWPLNNAMIHVSTGIPAAYRDRLKTEMDKFPYWKDDGIDMLAYLYDMLRDYRFSMRAPEDAERVAQHYMRKQVEQPHGWMVH